MSTLEWATTAPIVLGVGLSSYAQDAFHVLGFVMALLSNFMFSLRALHSKQVCQRNHCFPSITQFPVRCLPTAASFRSCPSLAPFYEAATPSPPLSSAVSMGALSVSTIYICSTEFPPLA